MKLNVKIMVVTGLLLLLTSALVASVAVWQQNRSGEMAVSQIEKLGSTDLAQLKSQGKKDEARFRQELLKRKKEYLKSQVQTAMSVLDQAYADSHSMEKLRRLYKKPLQNAVDTAFGVLKAVAAENGLTLEQQQQKAAAIIQSLRYGPTHKDYFWINDMHPTMVMHPYKPQLNGKDLSNVKDPNGKRLFMDFVKVCREKGGGFVDYYWPHYGGDKPVPKLSFVKLFKPWNWIIGSGVYLEVAESGLKANAAAIIQSLRYGPTHKDYFWINDMHPTMVMHPYKPQLNGKDLSNIKDPNGKRLFMDFVKVCREKGGGFVDYYWPRYGGDKPMPKLSYVQVFKPWNWVVGTGVYTDDIEKAAVQHAAELDKKVQAQSAAVQQQVDAVRHATRQKVKQVLKIIMLASVLVLAVALLVTYLFTRISIARPVQRIIEGLSQSAEAVAAASGQVSGAGQSLAEGSSEQAASIEETSSSLEEMSSIAKQNAGHAGQANTFMTETGQIVERANASMKGLNVSMEEIAKASTETSKIIKTIDEIAFQTNLLALNAAVEAARAGEAGAGFAVVADEVRNLAIRAAEAAKNTTGLIEDTTRKIQQGSEQAADTNRAFQQVTESAAKAAALVNEIAAASSEQAQGASQIAAAVAEMDKVTQSNAATAEEAAAASEEMSAQAEQMNALVRDLIKLVGESGQSAAAGVREGDRKKADKTMADVHKRSAVAAAEPAVSVPKANGEEKFEGF